jgi:hypothetical protein
MANERDNGVHKIADKLREQFFEGIPASERAAKEQQLNAANKRAHPESNGYFNDFATKM